MTIAKQAFPPLSSSESRQQPGASLRGIVIFTSNRTSPGWLHGKPNGAWSASVDPNGFMSFPTLGVSPITPTRLQHQVQGRLFSGCSTLAQRGCLRAALLGNQAFAGLVVVNDFAFKSPVASGPAESRGCVGLSCKSDTHTAHELENLDLDVR